MFEFCQDFDFFFNLVIDVSLGEDFLLYHLTGHLPASHNVNGKMNNRIGAALNATAASQSM